MAKVSAFRKIAHLAAPLLMAPLMLLAPLALAAEDHATVTYQRIFKGSNPEFIEIEVSDDGHATYDIRQLADDADPQALEVGQPLREKIFQLADQVHDFENVDLEVHHRMADLGQKTFRYEKGQVTHEAKFNYTLNRDASQLETIFEGLAQEQEDLLKLEQKVKYDHLGINDALRQFETDLDHRSLPQPQRLLPVLDRIAADSQLVDIARQRARAIAERIRTSTPN
jgi:hypothetical protein